MQDTLNRRIRFAPPQPTDENIVIGDSDIAIFEAIHRHGHLPANYLFEFSNHTNLVKFRQRLTQLYNGTKDGRRYLDRPPQQFAAFEARYQHLVYDLTDEAKSVLSQEGKLSPFLERTDPFLHRLMSACAGASLELNAKEKNIDYLPRSHMFYRAIEKGIDPELRLTCSLSAPRSVIVPDDLFALRTGERIRFFAVEIDRNTESIVREKKTSKTMGEVIDSYKDILETKVYQEAWAAGNLYILIFTTNETHADNLKKYADHSRFIFKVIPHFTADWRIPPVLNLIDGLI